MHSYRSWLPAAAFAFILPAVGLVPQSALAQGSDRPLGIGGKASWNLSRVRGDLVGEPARFDTGNGFSIGGLVTFAAAPNVTIQPELIYSKKKVDALVIEDGIVGEGEVTTDWFEIPVIAKFHGQRTEGARPFALAGLTLSFLTGAEQSATVMGMTVTDDIKDELTGTDVGFSFGGGVDFLQEWGVFSVDARYTFGLRRLAEDEDLKQDTFSVSGAVIF